MKKIIKKLFTASLILLISLSSLSVFADNPPDPGGDPTGNPVGGGSPIGGGLIILLALGSAYGSKKIYDVRKKIME